MMLIGLSIWLGYLLGSRSSDDLVHETEHQPLTTAIDRPTSTARVEQGAAEPRPDSRLTASDRAAELVQRIDQLAAQTNDRIIYEQRSQLLYDLARELQSSQASEFAGAISYYNLAMPRDSAGLMLESSYHKRGGRLKKAVGALINAAQFPESNEQLQQIQLLQADLLVRLFNEHAAVEDWLGLTDYFETLLISDPNNDRIRLYLADAKARGGNTKSALQILAVTGTEAGVTQQEISELRERLERADFEPIRFREEGSALVASANLNSEPVELLVDTGATKTALSTDVLRRLGAVRLNKTAQVMTAAGQITAELYQIPELEVERTLFFDPIVIALDNPPANWDGLLGMDLMRDMNVDLSNQPDSPK